MIADPLAKAFFTYLLRGGCITSWQQQLMQVEFDA
jgi:hypothetical protein